MWTKAGAYVGPRRDRNAFDEYRSALSVTPLLKVGVAGRPELSTRSRPELVERRSLSAGPAECAELALALFPDE